MKKWLTVVFSLVLTALLSGGISKWYFTGEKQKSPELAVVLLTPEKERSLREEGVQEERARREKEEKSKSPVVAGVLLTPEKEKSLREEGAQKERQIIANKVITSEKEGELRRQGAQEERVRREKEEGLLAEAKRKAEAELVEKKRELEKVLAEAKEAKDTYLASKEKELGKRQEDVPLDDFGQLAQLLMAKEERRIIDRFDKEIKLAEKTPEANRQSRIEVLKEELQEKLVKNKNDGAKLEARLREDDAIQQRVISIARTQQDRARELYRVSRRR